MRQNAEFDFHSMLCGYKREIKPPRQAVDVTCPLWQLSSPSPGAHTSMSPSFLLLCVLVPHSIAALAAHFGEPESHSRVTVDILSAFFSFLPPGIAIDIPHTAASFLVRLFFTIYF